MKSSTYSALRTLRFLPILCLCGICFASAPDTDFSEIATKLQTWATGSLGRFFALAFLVVGVSAGVIKQSLFGAVSGVAASIVLAYGPNIIQSVFGAIV